MPDDLRARLAALVATWRTQAERERTSHADYPAFVFNRCGRHVLGGPPRRDSRRASAAVMTDPHRTIDVLADQLGDAHHRYVTVRAALDAIEALAVNAITRAEVTEQRQAALVAALDTLVADWQRRATALQGPWGYLTYQASYIERAKELADELAKHREPRPALCPDCDHGIAGGRPCVTCGGSGYRR